MLRDVKFHRATFTRGSTKCTIAHTMCNFSHPVLQITSKVKISSPPLLPTVNNAAPERRQGAESPHSEGGNHIYGAFSPDDRRQNLSFFAQNVSAATLQCRSGRQGAVISRQGCSISTWKAELERNPNSEPRQDGGCWFLRYKKVFFFSFPDQRRRGRGAAITPNVNAMTRLDRQGRHSSVNRHHDEQL